MYNKRDIKYNDKILKLKETFKEFYKECKFKDLSLKLKEKYEKFDIYLIASDELYTIKNYVEKFNLKDKNKIIILTENIDVNHVLGCIDITSNLIYFKRSLKDIMEEIINCCGK